MSSHCPLIRHAALGPCLRAARSIQTHPTLAVNGERRHCEGTCRSGRPRDQPDRVVAASWPLRGMMLGLHHRRQKARRGSAHVSTRWPSTGHAWRVSDRTPKREVHSLAPSLASRLLPRSLRFERLLIRGPRNPLARVEARLRNLAAGPNEGTLVRFRNDRVTCVALSRGRTDIWIPVFKGRLTDSGGSVVLSGLLRPSWSAVFAFVNPFVLFAIGLLPRAEIRFQIIALAAASALVLWGIGPWFDRKNNAARRQAIIGLMERALAGGA
jgi:hypothetical protein